MTRRLGDAALTMVNGGDFRLDGGAMYGIVPKTVWSRLVSCDEHNRCTYSTHCLLVEIAGRRVLIDTGNGDKMPPELKERYGIDHDGSIATALGDLGVEPESIDLVVMTHLHFDHAGGATRRVGGELQPTFPRARHIVQAAELRAATHAHERNRASYLAENFAPLERAGLLELIDGERELLPGLRVLLTPGHTPGHQSVLIDGGNGQVALFLGDVVPTSLHIPVAWVMGYDLDVEATLNAKRAIYERARAGGWLLLFGHDRHHGTYLDFDERGRPVAGPPVQL